MLPDARQAAILLVFWHTFRSLGAMKIATYVLFGLLLAISEQRALADASLRLSADTPIVNVGPRNPGRGPLSLPDLEYRFNIDASCRDDMTPASLSLVIADTRRSFDTDQIDSGGLKDVRLKVPAAQIAPVVIADFCVAEAVGAELVLQAAAVSPLTVRAALSAQASLMCAGEGTQSIVYTSEALDLLLVCSDPGTASGVHAQ